MGFTGRTYTTSVDALCAMTPDSAWVRGLLSADGCVHSCGNVVSLSQSGDDGLRIVTEAKRILEYTGPIKTKGKVHAIYMCSQDLSRAAVSMGIHPRKSLTLQYPEMPSSLDAPFIRGYFEGDGHCSIKTNTALVVTPRMSLAGTKDFLTSCAERTPHPGHIKLHSTGRIHEQWWYGSQARAVFLWTYGTAGLYIGRKHGILGEFLSTWVTKEDRCGPMRREAVRLLKTGLRPCEVARMLGAHPWSVYTWNTRFVKCEEGMVAA